MEIRELETLAAVVESGGFNNAAKRLLMTQSAVSQTIARMEKKLGTTLVVRSTPPSLTPAGSRVLQFARDLFDDVHTLERDLADISRQSRGRVSLGASQMFTNIHLADLLKEFATKFPAISLDIANLPSRELVLKVLQGECEIGFGPFQQQMEEMQCHAYFPQPMKLYAGTIHTSFKKLQRGDDSALREAVLITSYLDPVENRPGARRLRYRFAGVWQVASLNLRVRMIADGLGIGYLPESLVDTHPLGKKLRAMDRLKHSTLERQVGLYYAKRRPLSTVGGLFVEFCDAYFSPRKHD